MKIWPPGGQFSRISPHLKYVCIPPQTKLCRYTGFTMAVCLSVHLPVGLGKSGFCTIGPLPFDIQWWYFTYMLTLTWKGPLLILTLIFLTVSYYSSIRVIFDVEIWPHPIPLKVIQYFNNYRVCVFTFKEVIWLDFMGHMTPKTRRLHINKRSFFNVKLTLPGNRC